MEGYAFTDGASGTRFRVTGSGVVSDGGDHAGPMIGKEILRLADMARQNWRRWSNAESDLARERRGHEEARAKLERLERLLGPMFAFNERPPEERAWAWFREQFGKVALPPPSLLASVEEARDILNRVLAREEGDHAEKV